jgi:hypothetical protein
MKRLNSFYMLMFTFVLLLLAPNLSAAVFSPEAFEIPYQINNSDHIVIGTVSEIEVHNLMNNTTITVDEWLYNPLPENTIIVRSTGWAEDARFTQNESVLLMLNDKSPLSTLDDHQSPEKGVFYMGFGEVGKHPISDRDAVIQALKAQGKWKGEDQTGNKTNETKTIISTGTVGNQKENVTENKTVDSGKEENIGTVDKQEEKPDTTHKLNRIPFISSFCALAIVLGTVVYLRKMK